MGKTKVSVDIKEQVLIITLNRPEKLNAFDLDMYRDLGRAYGELHRNPDLRCGLLAAAGAHFTSGLDLVAWAPHFGQGSFPELPDAAVCPLGLNAEKRLAKPVVMAAQGLCR